MKFEKTDIEGLQIIRPRLFEDERGYFFESYNEAVFAEKGGINTLFAQDNQSLSQKNILRGLHFQKPPHAQAKLVRAVKGSILDIAVDLRKSSSTYGKHYKILLSEKNKTMFFIPEGFAHGFLTLEDQTIFSYKCSNIYHKDSEETIAWDDIDLNIDWNIKNPILSEKDKIGQLFNEFNSPF